MSQCDHLSRDGRQCVRETGHPSSHKYSRYIPVGSLPALQELTTESISAEDNQFTANVRWRKQYYTDVSKRKRKQKRKAYTKNIKRSEKRFAGYDGDVDTLLARTLRQHQVCD